MKRLPRIARLVAARLPRSVRKAMHRAQDETGAALVELALFFSILGLPLFLGTIYYGTWLFDQIDVDNAAYAGALYAMRSSTYAEATTNIATAARGDSSRFGSNLGVSSSIFYVCSNNISGTQYSTQAGALAACTGGTNHNLEMVQVTATGTDTPAVKFPGSTKSINVSSTCIMEVEE